MILYGDTSALLKLYVRECGAIETRQQVASARVIGTSAITRVEIEAALSRAVRAGRVSAADLPLVLSELNRDWAGLYILPVSTTLLAEAAVLT